MDKPIQQVPRYFVTPDESSFTKESKCSRLIYGGSKSGYLTCGVTRMLCSACSKVDDDDFYSLDRHIMARCPLSTMAIRSLTFDDFAYGQAYCCVDRRGVLCRTAFAHNTFDREASMYHNMFLPGEDVSWSQRQRIRTVLKEADENEIEVHFDKK